MFRTARASRIYWNLGEQVFAPLGKGPACMFNRSSFKKVASAANSLAEGLADKKNPRLVNLIAVSSEGFD